MPADLNHRLFGSHRSSFGRAEFFLGLRDQRPLFLGIRQCRDLRHDRRKVALDIGHLARQAIPPLGCVAQRAFGLAALGGRVGALGGHRCQRAFTEGQRGGCLLESRFRGDLAICRSGLVRTQRFSFLSQPLQNVGIVADHLVFAGKIGVKLAETPLQLRLAIADALFLIVDLRLGNRQPLQGSARGSGRIAQFGQAMGADRLLLGCIHLMLGAVADSGGRLRQGRAGFAFLDLRRSPAQMQQDGLCLADLGRQVLETAGLARLTAQALDLSLQFARDVVQTLEILLGGAQAQFRLVTARMQSGNAGGFFQQLPPRLRLCLDQFADAALPDH